MSSKYVKPATGQSRMNLVNHLTPEVAEDFFSLWKLEDDADAEGAATVRAWRLFAEKAGYVLDAVQLALSASPSLGHVDQKELLSECDALLASVRSREAAAASLRSSAARRSANSRRKYAKRLNGESL